jgi:hypothetical protein
MNFHDFQEIWAVDFEFRISDGNLPQPICMVAKELRTGKTIKLWEDELWERTFAPFDVGPSSLFVAYYASAELGCFLSMGWPLPVYVLDLFAEFRNLTNGLSPHSGNGLLGALSWFGLDTLDAVEKSKMRDLILYGGHYSTIERTSILQYCETDVLSLERLFTKMKGKISAFYALIRGRYLKAAAHMERNGVPLDVPLLRLITSQWTQIQDSLIREIDQGYGVFEGRVFKRDRWARYLHENNIPWPVLPSGEIALDEETFREMARIYPQIESMYQLRQSLSQFRFSKLSVGDDGRNRCLLSAFSSKTGRNQPSTSKFIFGQPVWMRSLIKHGPKNATAYIDWEQQEVGIAAAYSEDPAMMEAYMAGDPYIEFAKMAKAVPADATKYSHLEERKRFKATTLAVQYGMGAEHLAQNLGISSLEAKGLLQLHRSIFRKFWSWSDAAVDYAYLYNRIYTVFNWQLHVSEQTNSRTLRNFPMQANGAEMLRLACCLATERGIKVCAPVHDALLIEAPISEIDAAVEATQEAMQEASEIVLSGFPLRSEAVIVRYPERYMDERGKQMWDVVMKHLNCNGKEENI